MNQHPQPHLENSSGALIDVAYQKTLDDLYQSLRVIQQRKQTLSSHINKLIRKTPIVLKTCLDKEDYNEAVVILADLTNIAQLYWSNPLIISLPLSCDRLTSLHALSEQNTGTPRSQIRTSKETFAVPVDPKNPTYQQRSTTSISDTITIFRSLLSLFSVDADAYLLLDAANPTSFLSSILPPHLSPAPFKAALDRLCTSIGLTRQTFTSFSFSSPIINPVPHHHRDQQVSASVFLEDWSVEQIHQALHMIQEFLVQTVGLEPMESSSFTFTLHTTQPGSLWIPFTSASSNSENPTVSFVMSQFNPTIFRQISTAPQNPVTFSFIFKLSNSLSKLIPCFPSLIQTESTIASLTSRVSEIVSEAFSSLFLRTLYLFVSTFSASLATFDWMTQSASVSNEEQPLFPFPPLLSLYNSLSLLITQFQPFLSSPNFVFTTSTLSAILESISLFHSAIVSLTLFSSAFSFSQRILGLIGDDDKPETVDKIPLHPTVPSAAELWTANSKPFLRLSPITPLSSFVSPLESLAASHSQLSSTDPPQTFFSASLPPFIPFTSALISHILPLWNTLSPLFSAAENPDFQVLQVSPSIDPFDDDFDFDLDPE
ncbi:hypothetical protein BLNAU_6450 [Blattamonas nauphoetae]|uniref:Uncharacterized protein n=1 Tax=Blattamonas nauphoetae TaxID=2049346 RepID=A0ABQ9Y4M3_9EUKA|nr:hypothetical protein BLNAU_6450 [Blattamonas nauphoetae]